MTWFLAHINHFTAPLGVALGLLSALAGLTARRNRKAGRPPMSEGLKAFMILVIVICAVVFGMALVADRKLL